MLFLNNAHHSFLIWKPFTKLEGESGTPARTGVKRKSGQEEDPSLVRTTPIADDSQQQLAKKPRLGGKIPGNVSEEASPRRKGTAVTPSGSNKQAEQAMRVSCLYMYFIWGVECALFGELPLGALVFSSSRCPLWQTSYQESCSTSTFPLRASQNYRYWPCSYK